MLYVWVIRGGEDLCLLEILWKSCAQQGLKWALEIRYEKKEKEAGISFLCKR